MRRCRPHWAIPMALSLIHIYFAMTEHFGFQLIPIPMHNDGPDMDMIEDLVQRDASIKGIDVYKRQIRRMPGCFQNAEN